MPDKMSQEKISILRGYGAEVVITPTAVEHDSPESYYSVSSRLAEEIPGGFKPDQYSNMANPEAHYLTTGPEIWEQTGGELDAIVDLGRHRRNDQRRRPLLQGAEPEVQIVGVDPEGSIYTAKSESDLHPYFVEGIGKDTWPETMDPTWSTSGSASPTATRSSPRAAWRARRGCSSAARRARRSPARSSTRRGWARTRRC